MNAVYDDDIEEIIDTLELGDPIKNDELKCSICDRSVDQNDIGVIFGKSGEIHVKCKKPACLANEGSLE